MLDLVFENEEGEPLMYDPDGEAVPLDEENVAAELKRVATLFDYAAKAVLNGNNDEAISHLDEADAWFVGEVCTDHMELIRSL